MDEEESQNEEDWRGLQRGAVPGAGGPGQRWRQMGQMDDLQQAHAPPPPPPGLALGIGQAYAGVGRQGGGRLDDAVHLQLGDFTPPPPSPPPRVPRPRPAPPGRARPVPGHHIIRRHSWQGPASAPQMLGRGLAWGRDLRGAGSRDTPALANDSLLKADPGCGCTPLHLALAAQRWVAVAQILHDPRPVARRWLAALAQIALAAEDAVDGSEERSAARRSPPARCFARWGCVSVHLAR